MNRYLFSDNSVYRLRWETLLSDKLAGRKAAIKYFVLLVAALSLLSACTVYGFASDVRPATEVKKVLSDSNDSEISEALGFICSGRLDDARRSIDVLSPAELPEANSVKQIICDFEQIEKRREQSRSESYQEQLTEFSRYKPAIKSQQGGTTDDVADANYIIELDDSNDITKVLSTIYKAVGFANERQKEQLLSDQFVRKVTQKSVEHAARFQSQGNWLDAYLVCYNWLEKIYEDDKAYQEQADRLVDLANIEASFRDSPCESRKKRYEGVEKQMFIRAVETLHFNYVRIVDYRKMAEEGIRRCSLAAQAMAKMDKSAVDANFLAEKQIYEITDEQVARWRLGLNNILNAALNSLTGVGKGQFLKLFEDVLALNNQLAAVDSQEADPNAENSKPLLPEKFLIAQFTMGALSALDPYTVLVWPKQVKDFEKILTNQFSGIGIEIGKPKGFLKVSSLLPGTPAYHSGLDAGDIIVKVDGTPTKDMSLGCAVKNITGPEGTTVTLTIRRPDEQKTREISITRAKITVPSIRGWKRTQAGRWLYMLEPNKKIGYVRITSFSENTSDKFEGILDELEEDGMKALILDLRFNSGGLLKSAIEISDKFIDSDLIVSTRPRYGVWSYAHASKKGTHPDYPLVILINSRSASASEIVAGAMQDDRHNRAVLVGERTHGKGSVQGITMHPGGGGKLKYTMAYYHLPSGQRVESKQAAKQQGRTDWGVGPDIQVKLTSNELRQMLEVQKQNDVLVRADHDNGRSPLQKHSVKETLNSDPQLAAALLISKAQLLRKSLKLVAEDNCN